MQRADVEPDRGGRSPRGGWRRRPQQQCVKSPGRPARGVATRAREHERTTPFANSGNYVFATRHGTPLGHRNVEGRALPRAASAAGFNRGGLRVRFHDLRHTFASHMIVDLGLDVAQVSRILGHASITTTLNIYTHLFDDARHATEIRTRMAASPFARLLDPHAGQLLDRNLTTRL